MIHLKSKGAPAGMRSSAVRQASDAARKFFEIPPQKRAQQRFSFNDTPLDAPAVKEPLIQLTSGKCAYCESPFSPRRLIVDRFRPAMAALALNGAVSHDHYWWLAYEWENLLPACADCSRSKGTRFPVEAKRARPGEL